MPFAASVALLLATAVLTQWNKSIVNTETNQTQFGPSNSGGKANRMAPTNAATLFELQGVRG
jgi:hypothetical protein